MTFELDRIMKLSLYTDYVWTKLEEDFIEYFEDTNEDTNEDNEEPITEMI